MMDTMDLSRRQFLSRALAGGVAACAAGSERLGWADPTGVFPQATASPDRRVFDQQGAALAA